MRSSSRTVFVFGVTMYALVSTDVVKYTLVCNLLGRSSYNIPTTTQCTHDTVDVQSQSKKNAGLGEGSCFRAHFAVAGVRAFAV